LEVKKLQRKVWSLEKRESRSRKQHTPLTLSPSEKVERLTEGKFVSPDVRYELFKGLVL